MMNRSLQVDRLDGRKDVLATPPQHQRQSEELDPIPNDQQKRIKDFFLLRFTTLKEYHHHGDQTEDRDDEI